ncbi:MAG: membrane lipoprotein lipid attachment site-containing protein [Ruminococcus sp.]|nr:membrane lipoprotein lipid attachment site-containing protein [Ruminococcus sp.]MDE6783958.1 membrane lipoprotein lipid attachment site-containing protein [Ruminococcus sp.]
MRKFLFILCSVFLLTGCSDKTSESSITETVPESTTELQTEKVTTEMTTETTTEATISNVYEKQTYREVLENMYYDCKFLDWDYKNYNRDVPIDFAVYDIDSDGRDELLVTFDHRAIYVYDHNADGNLVKQLSGYIRSDFYENGAVRVYSAHNQTHSFKVSPFVMYKYNKETDSYDECGNVSGIDKDIVDRVNQQIEEVGGTEFFEYPAEYDTSSSGTVYYWINEAVEPLDVTEYNKYYAQFTENTDIIDIPFMELTEENIENVSE